jgi:fatty-acyl-CoA synthase
MRTSALDLPTMIRRAKAQFPDAPAIDDGRRSLTLGQAVEGAERFANALDALDVPIGAAVGVLMENRAEYVEVDLGIALARRVRVALNARLGLDDFRYMAEDSQMRALVHSDAFAEPAEALAAELSLVPISVDAPVRGGHAMAELIAGASATPVVRPVEVEDPCWISYTSGTTGRPKGVVLSHRAIREVTFNVLVELGPICPGDRIVLPQPVSHGAGYFVLPHLISGGGVFVMTKFDPEHALALSRRPGIHTLKVVPAMLPRLIDAAASAGNGAGYETIIYGAAPIAPPALEAALERFGPVLVQIYGQSEAPATLTCLSKADHIGKGAHRFSAGRPWRTVTLDLRDAEGRPLTAGEVGEVVVSGPHMMTGYHRLPDATAEVFAGDWLRTRDMAVRDERGYIYLKGRSDEMINSGGFNISPREVERVLGEHPDVAEVTVVGLPDERWGHAVAAAVRVRPGAQLTGEDLIASSRPALGFRAPKSVVIVAEIPKTAYGKVDRQRIVSVLTGGKAA